MNFSIRGIAASVMLVLVTASSSHAVCSAGALQSKIQRSNYLFTQQLALSNQQTAASQRGDQKEFCRLGWAWLSMNKLVNEAQADAADCFAALGRPVQLNYKVFRNNAEMESMLQQHCC